jgi:hypothetical protein
MSSLPKQCLQCGSAKLYTSRVENVLRGLGGFLRFPKFDVVMCADCGRCEFFADEEAREKVTSSGRWHRLGDAGS